MSELGVSRGQQLIEQIKASKDDAESDRLVNELLSEFHRGFAIDSLRSLLVAKDDRVLDSAVWIAAELGKAGAPLMDAVTPLLNHKSRAVRFHAIDALSTWLTPADVEAFLAVLELLGDSEHAVRWKVLDFLSITRLDVLRAGLAHLRVARPGSQHIHALEWLVDTALDTGSVKTTLLSGDAVTRKYAVVAAARIARASGSREALTFASSLQDDADISGYASSMLKLA